MSTSNFVSSVSSPLFFVLIKCRFCRVYEKTGKTPVLHFDVSFLCANLLSCLKYINRGLLFHHNFIHKQPGFTARSGRSRRNLSVVADFQLQVTTLGVFQCQI